LGFGFRISGYEFQVTNFRFRISSYMFPVSNFGIRVSGFEFRVSNFKFRISNFKFEVWGFGNDKTYFSNFFIMSLCLFNLIKPEFMFVQSNQTRQSPSIIWWITYHMGDG